MSTESNEGKGHQDLGEGSLINDPGNEDPGSIIEDAPVPLKNDPDAKPPMQKQVEPPYDLPKAHIGGEGRKADS
ncbi:MULTISPECIES: hypothetical protein [Pseudomonas]|uniref:hypothetical protein n=1 Tax=Pseudomonas TaxID=286 RepID=UPI00249C54F6|nr:MULTISPECIES: hypothetical protein [Pseudomonas]